MSAWPHVTHGMDLSQMKMIPSSEVQAGTILSQIQNYNLMKYL